MARIPEAELEQLKADVSLVRLVEASGIVLVRQGKDWAGSCPFHRDDTPSLLVSPGKNLYHCFGCGAAGGPIDWVMKRQGVSFRHAVALLREQAPVDAAAGSHAPERTSVRTLAAPVPPEASDAAALQRVVDFYHATLKQSPEALGYLQQRGLTHPELIDHFKLGYANRTLAYRLPEKSRAAGAALRGQLQRIGLLRASGHEHFNGSLVVPVCDASGKVVEVYGRKLLDNLRAGTPKHLYLPGPHAGIFNRAALAASKEIILCEALLDAMAFWCAGYRHVTSAFGTQGVTDELLAAFAAHGTQRVLIAFDRDAAGDEAAQALASRLIARGIDCYRVLFPKGMDAAEYALRVQPATRSLGLVLRQAQWLGQGQAPVRMAMIAPVSEVQAFMTSDVAAASDVMPSANTLAQEAPVDLPLAAAVDAVASATTEPVLSASPVPTAPHTPTPDAVVVGDEMRLVLHECFYRVRGLPTKPSPEQLKVNLLVKPAADAGRVLPVSATGYHVDTVDLYSARQRQAYARQASVELGCSEDAIRRDIGALILALEAWQEETRAQAGAAAVVTVSESERTAALALLRDPTLLDRILADFALAGVVGEDTNKLVGYLACVSRKLARPLAVIIQSSSAAGKSSLQEAILALMPPEEAVRYSAMTGQSLYYLGQAQLKHKILAIAEEEGAARASYALKLLQSEGELTIASTGKDATTGQLVTQEYRVEGPVMLFLTTTAIDIDEELLNRCLVLTVNESREQTQAIHAVQRARRTLPGLLAQVEKDAVLAVHRNAQRLLRSLAVVNPYADQLTFLDHKTRTRRDHEKYLALIDAIALLHQFQREVQQITHHGRTVEYIEVQRGDIAAANTLAHAVLGHCLDELPPVTRRLLQIVTAQVRAQCARQACALGEVRFSRKQIRDACGWGGTQLAVHLERLVALEYLLVHRGRRGQSFEYELLCAAEEDAATVLPGLIDAAALQAAATTAGSRGGAGGFAGACRPQTGAISGTDQGDDIAAIDHENSGLQGADALPTPNARRRANGTSHRTDALPAALA